MLIVAIMFITFALLFYSIGVWAEKAKNTLKKWHVVVFWIGFICDTIGTAAMGQMAKSNSQSGLDFHSISGAAALVLMFFHAAWATFVIIRNDDKTIKSFHKLSIVVWIIWLIPYFTGMIMGMRTV